MTPIQQPTARRPWSSTILCMLVIQQSAVPRQMPHFARRDIRQRARSATPRIAPQPPACRAPHGSGWSAACWGTGWPRRPMGCSQRKQSPDPLGHRRMKLPSRAALPLQTPAPPCSPREYPRSLVAAILQQGWAASLLVSPHRAPPGEKNPPPGHALRRGKPMGTCHRRTADPTRH